MHPPWIEDALDLAWHGWFLVPMHARHDDFTCTCGVSTCPTPGRHPRAPNWKAEMAKDRRSIESWAPLWQEATLGLVTGTGSQLLIVEVRNPDCLRRLEDEHRPLPPTTTFRRGAYQFYLFTHPGYFVPELSTISQRGDDIRLHGELSLVPIPPPRHTDWIEPPALTDPAAIPDWLINAVGVELPSHQQTKSLPFRPFAHLVSSTTNIEQIAPPWAARGSLTVLVGPPKCAGKTTMLLKLVEAVNTGQPFLGTPTTITPVLYLTEQAPYSIRTVAGTKPDFHHTRILCREHTDNMEWPSIARGVLREAHDTGAQLVVIDSLDSFTNASSCSSLSEIGVLTPIRDLIATRLSIVAVVQSCPETTLPGALQHLGELGRLADTVISISPPDDNAVTRRTITWFGRFSSGTQVVELKNDTLQRLLQTPTPLFPNYLSA